MYNASVLIAASHAARTRVPRTSYATPARQETEQPTSVYHNPRPAVLSVLCSVASKTDFLSITGRLAVL